MRTIKTALRSALIPLVAVTMAACASSGMPELDADQALFRVENDTEETYVTVSLEDMDGNVLPLGSVREDAAENFVFEVPEGIDRYRLIAVGPDDEGRGDHTLSEVFEIEGGATVNWYILANELEVS